MCLIHQVLHLLIQRLSTSLVTLPRYPLQKNSTQRMSTGAVLTIPVHSRQDIKYMDKDLRDFNFPISMSSVEQILPRAIRSKGYGITPPQATPDGGRASSSLLTGILTSGISSEDIEYEDKD